MSDAGTPHPRSSDSWLGFLALALITIYVVVAVYAAQSALATNALHLPFARKLHMVYWLPEGWKFFTRNPREDRLHCFTREATGRWREIHVGPLADPDNAFGLLRARRRVGVEAAFLMTGIPEAAWRRCMSRPEACLDSIQPYAIVHDPIPRPVLEGRVALVRQTPLPWAWLPSAERVTMPSRILVLTVVR